MIRIGRTFVAVVAALTLAGAAAIAIPGSGHAAACTTTVSSLAAVASAVDDAAVGASVCLSDGSYGRLSLSVSKGAPGVTVRAEHPGQATLAGAVLDGSYVTVAQFRMTGTFEARPGSTGMAADHNVFVGGGYYAVMAAATSTTTVNDVAITNNRFVGRFDEDAIRLNRYHDGPDADPYGVLIEGNEFTGNVEYGGHNDVLQSVWVGDHLYFRRNYLHDFGGQGFFVKDQASAIDGLVVEDNLIVRQSSPCDPVSLCPTWQLSPFQIFGPLRNASIRHNTVWPGTSGGQAWLRGVGWTGPTVFTDNVMDSLNSDAIDLLTGYTSSNNTRCSGIGFPDAGITQDCSPAFIDPANGDYRQANGRGVTWKVSDQQYGPTSQDSSPPPAQDTTAPNTTIASGPSGSTTQTSASFGFSSDEGGSTFECKLDATDYASCSSPKSYSGLAVGVHTFSVRATDAAGNVDATPAMRGWTISGAPDDTTAPKTTISSGPSGPTNDRTPSFAFAADDAGATFSCRADDGAWADCTSPWTTSALADGDHSVSVRASDDAGNTEATPASRSFTVDTASPHTTIESGPPATSTTNSASIAFTVDEAGGTSQCQIDANDWVDCTSPFAISGLAQGAHTVIVRSTDGAGNVESPGASVSWTVEVPSGGDPGEPPPATDGAPTATITSPYPGTLVDGGFLVTASASDDHGVDHVDLWVDDTRVASDTTAPFRAWVHGEQLSAATHTLSARAFDAPGQAASAAITVRVVSDVSGWTRSSRWARLSSAAGAGGVTLLSGRTTSNRLVGVELTPCDSADGAVADSFDLRADDDGRLTAVYAGAGLCVLRLVPYRT
jgi:hypothetical protein